MVRLLADLAQSKALALSLVLVCGTACSGDDSSENEGTAKSEEPSASSDKADAGKAPEAKSKTSEVAETMDETAQAAKSAATEPVSPATKGMAQAPAKDGCGLHTQYEGDDYCIAAPDPEKGWQLHIGPEDYDNVDPKYILKPGEERTDSFSTTSTNTEKKFFYYRQFRMRPGAHHNIITASSPNDGSEMRADTGGRRIGTTNHLIEDNPLGGVIAPENKGVGIPLEPNSKVSVSLHSINTTDKPLLREVWANFWYRDESEVTEPVAEMFQAGDTRFAIQPKEDTVLGPYSCNIEGDGRMLWFYGHRHANNVRFSAWRIRDGKRELFYEGLNWEEPLVLEYSSTVMNMVPDRDKNIEGGWSGVLDMKTGDTIEWECHIVNQTDKVLRFTNNTFTGEMCIMDAELVGANCPARRGAPAEN